MDKLLKSISSIKELDSAIELFKKFNSKNLKVFEALEFAIRAHEGEFRKSGEEYVIHPILVAVLIRSIGGDDEMVISGLLHDVVEDTDCSIEDIERLFGGSVKTLVDGLTKITEIRDDELLPSSANKKIISSALSFRKILISSIDDVRVLVVKLCDRLHNMYTLNALTPSKQKRISEETLVVYVPIAHRLGISKIKNSLEDICFKYLFREKYNEISYFLESNMQQFQLKLNNFIDDLQKLMLKNGFIDGSFEIESRIKHKYSIYLKLQRKGVSIEEVLDLLALRVFVKDPIDCYQVLGLIHQSYKPLITRFKDYISIPKENGYQTLHTSVFNNAQIFEVQIRTFDMHKSATYGLASHWKYKGHDGLSPNLKWLDELKQHSESSSDIDELLDATRKGLYSADIAVFSPQGKIFALPRGATVLDFAFAVHTEVGLCAKEAYVNKRKVPFLTQLKNGDIVRVVTGEKEIPRCSWVNSVRTSKAKTAMVYVCRQKTKEMNNLIGRNILLTIFNISEKNLFRAIDRENLSKKLYLCATSDSYLQEYIYKIKKSIISNSIFIPIISPLKSFKLKEKNFDNISVIGVNNYSKLSFDYCCHPKMGDDIVGLRRSSEVIVHHKLCLSAKKMLEESHKAVFVKWGVEKEDRYKLIVSIENKKGALANLLQYLAKMDIDLLNIELSHEEDSLVSYFEITVKLPKHRKIEELQFKDKRCKLIYSSLVE